METDEVCGRPLACFAPLLRLLVGKAAVENAKVDICPKYLFAAQMRHSCKRTKFFVLKNARPSRSIPAKPGRMAHYSP
jgi:hypothetical protein